MPPTACSAGTGDSSLRAHPSGGMCGGRGNDRHGCWVYLAIGYSCCVHPASSRAQLAHVPVEHGNLSLRWDKAPARTGIQSAMPAPVASWSCGRIRHDRRLPVCGERAGHERGHGRAVISITGRFTKNMFGSPRATTVPACHDRLRQRRKPGDWQSLISGHGHGGAAPSAHKQVGRI